MARQRSPPPTLRSDSLFPRLQPPSRTERPSSLRPPNPRAKSEGGQRITTYRNIKIDDFPDIASCPQERNPFLRKALAGEKKTRRADLLLSSLSLQPGLSFSLTRPTQTDAFSRPSQPVSFTSSRHFRPPQSSPALQLQRRQRLLSRHIPTIALPPSPISPAALPCNPNPRPLSFPPRRRRFSLPGTPAAELTDAPPRPPRPAPLSRRHAPTTTPPGPPPHEERSRTLNEAGPPPQPRDHELRLRNGISGLGC